MAGGTCRWLSDTPVLWIKAVDPQPVEVRDAPLSLCIRPDCRAVSGGIHARGRARRSGACVRPHRKAPRSLMS